MVTCHIFVCLVFAPCFIKFFLFWVSAWAEANNLKLSVWFLGAKKKSIAHGWELAQRDLLKKCGLEIHSRNGTGIWTATAFILSMEQNKHNLLKIHFTFMPIIFYRDSITKFYKAFNKQDVSVCPLSSESKGKGRNQLLLWILKDL